MKWTAYIYRAPTEEELEIGGMGDDALKETTQADSLRDIIHAISVWAPAHEYDYVEAVEASAWPAQGGEWISVFFRSGARADLFRNVKSGIATPTPSSSRRVEKQLALWV